MPANDSEVHRSRQCVPVAAGVPGTVPGMTVRIGGGRGDREPFAGK
jgi:hypothetical protein